MFVHIHSRNGRTYVDKKIEKNNDNFDKEKQLRYLPIISGCFRANRCQLVVTLNEVVPIVFRCIATTLHSIEKCLVAPPLPNESPVVDGCHIFERL